jgi:hypothetical protein
VSGVPSPVRYNLLERGTANARWHSSWVCHVGPPTLTVFDPGVDEGFSSIKHVDLSRESDEIGPIENIATAEGVLGIRVGLVSLTIGGWTGSPCQAVR